MRYLIGVDIGTSGTKTVLFDEQGNTVASATVEYPMYQPQNGWAEQDADDWWRASVSTLKQVVEGSGVAPSDIKGIGLSGQMHGLVMLDEENKVLRRSIIWCDQRTAKQCEEINRIVGEDKVIEITANPVLTGFTAPKILWVRENEPEIYEKCRHMLLPKDYVRFKMTGEFVTDVSDASGMSLLNVAKRDWSDEMLDALGIKKEMMARVMESSHVSGYTTKELEELTGIPCGTPVAAGAGDNAAAAVGTGVVENSKAFTTIGTSGVVFAHTDKPVIDKKGRVHTFCCAVDGCWHVMGVTQGAGLSLKWLRDNFCYEEKAQAQELDIDVYQLMDSKAAQIPIGSQKLLFLPYLMGERTPHLDPDCRGVFFGISAVHTKANFIRSVMEGVSYSLRDCVEIIREMGIQTDNMYACGGGAVSPLWRQMLADLFGCNVKTVSSKEGPALGAAILAGVCSGVYKNVVEGCKIAVKDNKIQTQIEENSCQYEPYYQLYRKLYPALKDNFKALAEM